MMPYLLNSDIQDIVSTNILLWVKNILLLKKLEKNDSYLTDYRRI